MHSNLSINSCNTVFQAKVSKKFINSAHKAFDREIKNRDLLVNFDEKVTEFDNFGYDNFYIKYIKDFINGKVQHKIIAATNSMKDEEGVLLTSKDRFRKAIEKFTHITKYEFSKKMSQGLKKS